MGAVRKVRARYRLVGGIRAKREDEEVLWRIGPTS
jgi:hypothetical protein